jgi:peptide/nickel transport system substrate-binding protein
MSRRLRSLVPALLLALLPLEPPRRRCASASPRPRRARPDAGAHLRRPGSSSPASCDKLFDIDEKLQIVPQLATAYEWSADSKALTLKIRPGVTFHDGEKLDAAAVKFNIERHKTMAGSNRRGELAPVATVDVVDPMTVRINLSAPFSPLLAQLSDRAGMMVSPKAAQAEGDKFGTKPVCSGPFKFVERVAQDRIVLEKYAGYWNKDQIHFDKIVYTPIPDATGAPRPTCARASSTSSSASPRATWRS